MVFLELSAPFPPYKGITFNLKFLTYDQEKQPPFGTVQENERKGTY